MHRNEQTLYTFISIALVLFLFSSGLFSAQNKSSTDKEYIRIRDEMRINNKNLSPQRINEIGDSLYAKADTNLQKISALLISTAGAMHKQEGDKVLLYSGKIDSIANIDGLYEYRIGANGTMASQYLSYGMMQKSNEKLQLVLELNKKLTQKTGVENKRIIIVTNTELGSNNRVQKKYPQAEKYLKKALDILKNENEKEYAPLTALTRMELASVYYESGQLDKAKAENNAIIAISDKYIENVLMPSQARINLAKIALKENDMKTAYRYLSAVKKHSEKLKQTHEETDLQKTLKEYYEKTGNKPASDSIKTELLTQLENKQETIVHIANNTLKEEKKATENEKAKNLRLTYLIAAITVLASAAIFFIKKREKTIRKKNLAALISRIKEENEAEQEREKQEAGKEKEPKTTLIEISSSKEEEILEKLHAFEREHHYIQNVSLASMAAELNTNTKYLSHILDKYRNKTFTDYINHQRISYIVKLLYQEPKTRKYKVSYLAEMCGFTSHSYFAKVFKNETKVSPSEYLRKLEEI